jgi:hypothetical protein
VFRPWRVRDAIKLQVGFRESKVHYCRLPQAGQKVNQRIRVREANVLPPDGTPGYYDYKRPSFDIQRSSYGLEEVELVDSGRVFCRERNVENRPMVPHA